MAKQIWETRIRSAAFPADRRALPDWFTVIGVVADFQHFQGDNERPVIRRLRALSIRARANTGLTIRVAGDRVDHERGPSADPRGGCVAARVRFRTLEAARGGASGRPPVRIMFSIFGSSRLLTIGVMACFHAVSQRTQEIGVARRARRRRMRCGLPSVRQLAGVGVIVGISRRSRDARSGILYNVTPTDPLSFATCPCPRAHRCRGSYFPRDAMAVIRSSR